MIKLYTLVCNNCDYKANYSLPDKPANHVLQYCDKCKIEELMTLIKEVNIEEISKTILEEARELTDGIRQQEYGSVQESFGNIATIATILCGHIITPIEIAIILKSVKLVRESHKHKKDNLTDECGYARLESILKGDETS